MTNNTDSSKGGGLGASDGLTDARRVGGKQVGKPSVTATSAGSVLRFDLDEFKGFDMWGNNNEETVLIAPTREIQRQWQQLYPGIKVVRSQRLYPLPKGYHRVTDLQPSDSDTKVRQAND